MSTRNLPRSHLSAAERMARLLRNNTASRFATAFARDPCGINTERVLDKEKTHALQRASI